MWRSPKLQFVFWLVFWRLGAGTSKVSLFIIVETGDVVKIFPFWIIWGIKSGCRGTTYSWTFSRIILLPLVLTTAEFFVTSKFFLFTPVSLIALMWLRCWTRWLGFLLTGVFYMTLALSLLLLMFVSLQARAVTSGIVLIYFLYLQSRPIPSLFFSDCGFSD